MARFATRGAARGAKKAGKYKRVRRKVCMFCVDRVEFIDYKAMQRFAHFQPMTLTRIPRFDQEALEPA